MKKKLVVGMLVASMCMSALVGCGDKKEAQKQTTDTVATEAVEETTEAVEEETTEVTDRVTDETFEALQDAYVELDAAYNSLVSVYANEDVEENVNVEEALSQSDEAMKEVQVIQQGDISEEEGQKLLANMQELVTALNELTDAVVADAGIVLEAETETAEAETETETEAETETETVEETETAAE